MKKTFLLVALLSSFVKFTFAQAGQLDSLFGDNGIVKTDLGANYDYELLCRQVLLRDTSLFSILQSSGQTLIAKKNSNGVTDSSYGNNGFSRAAAMVPVYGAIQPGGKIAVAGFSFDGMQDNYMIVRFNTDGTLDKTFGANGTQAVDFPVTSVAAQKDGKILATGSVTNKGNSYFEIARYNTDGNLDSGFAINGKRTSDFGFSKPSDKGGEYPESDLGYSVAVQSNGKIIVSGSAFNYTTNSREFAIARYNTDGKIDSSFSNDGKRTSNFGAAENYGYSIAFQSDGKLVVAGYANVNGNTYDLAIARYNPDGSYDHTFDGDGKKTVSFGSVDHNRNKAVIQKDGKIVIEGDSYDGSNYDFSIARLNKNGSLDNTFNGNGKKVTDLGSTSDYANSVVIEDDGKIIEAGSTFNGNNYKSALVRYNTNGSLDKTFFTDGISIQGLNQGYTIYTSSVVLQNGEIIAAGYTWSGSNYDFVVVRYNTDGSLDSSFSADGKHSTDFSSGDDFANSVSLQKDGKIVVAGYTNINNTTSHLALARYNTDGSLDKTFSGDGKQTTNFGFYAEIGGTAAIQSDGKIVIAGSVFTGSNYDSVDIAVARYNTDGSLDKTFSNDGKKTTDLNSSDDFISSVSIQSDNKIVVTGRTSDGIKNDFALVRYNPDGTLDKTFSGDGKQISDFGTADYFGEAAAIQPDGKIILAGYTQVENVGSSIAVARYNKNGQLDTAFNHTGLKTRDFGSGFEVATSVALQSNGKIVVAGGTNGNFTLIRYNSNGTIDSTFSSDGVQVTRASGGDDRIQAISIADDKLYAAGYGSYPATLGVEAKYLLTNGTTPPAVSLTTPTNNAAYPGPAANINLAAAASDADGTITKVEFYRGAALLHTETAAPYGYHWKNVPVGKYTLTAKAYDNSGNVTTSAPVHISVVSHKAPVVSIVKPVNNQSFAAPAFIHWEAVASDSGGTITKVEFYNGSTLLRIEKSSPYTYVWKNAPAGTYRITAVATDNLGARTTSAPITVKVTSNNQIVSNRPSAENEKTPVNDALSMRLSPNPAGNIINISVSLLQQNKPAIISVISTAGIVLKTMHISNAVTQLDVSSLVSGVYTIKIVSGAKVMYKQFVKL